MERRRLSATAFIAGAHLSIFELMTSNLTQLQQELGSKGRLTPTERDEYEAMIRVGNFVAILQAKARRLLTEGMPPDGRAGANRAPSALFICRLATRSSAIPVTTKRLSSAADDR
jgi:hypothetical protein